MPQRFARFSGSGPSHHTRSLAGFIIITFGFRFSVHTGIPMPTANKAMAIEPAADLWVRVCPSENARNAEGRCGRVKGKHYQSSEAHT
jgi:hypothetical protein